MKAPRFEFARATDTAEAVRLLARRGEGARLLGGGQSLVPMLNLRLVQPEVVIDLNGVEELAGIRAEPDAVRIGALTRYSEIENSAEVGERIPLLADAVRYVGDRLIRNRGTLGGSLAQCDPSAEMPLVALVLDATIVCQDEHEQRELPIDELIVGPYETSLAPNEMIVEVTYPAEQSRAHAFLEIVRRHGDYPVVAVAASGVPAPDGSWESVRIGLRSGTPRPYPCRGRGCGTRRATLGR
ncbi:MAG: FAD binding domain-containing protein [Acidimicrobiia bacterium]|nr:FAD binding domain-containing protein [Acidimicrobiia bacterium]